MPKSVTVEPSRGPENSYTRPGTQGRRVYFPFFDVTLFPDSKTHHAPFAFGVGGVFRKHTQQISQSFLDNVAEQRNRSREQRENEFMSVAQIPTIVVEKWMREGFDIFSGEHSAADIVKRLKRENLDAFLTTEKSV